MFVTIGLSVFVSDVYQFANRGSFSCLICAVGAFTRVLQLPVARFAAIISAQPVMLLPWSVCLSAG